MRKIVLAALVLAATYGTLAVASDVVTPALHYLGGLDSADTGSGVDDTGSTDDTGDTSSGDDTSSGSGDDTSSGGDDTSTGGDDTGDTGATDTGRWGYSAAELAGETGGFGCTTLGGRVGGMWVLLSAGLLVLRRRAD